MTLTWLEHVKNVMKKTGLSLKEALPEAKKTWTKIKNTNINKKITRKVKKIKSRYNKSSKNKKKSLRKH